MPPRERVYAAGGSSTSPVCSWCPPTATSRSSTTRGRKLGYAHRYCTSSYFAPAILLYEHSLDIDDLFSELVQSALQGADRRRRLRSRRRDDGRGGRWRKEANARHPVIGGGRPADAALIVSGGRRDVRSGLPSWLSRRPERRRHALRRIRPLRAKRVEGFYGLASRAGEVLERHADHGRLAPCGQGGRRARARRCSACALAPFWPGTPRRFPRPRRRISSSRATTGIPCVASMQHDGTDRTRSWAARTSVSANSQLVAFTAAATSGSPRATADSSASHRHGRRRALAGFSPNGRSIVFATEITQPDRGGGERGNIVRIQTDGTDRRKLTTPASSSRDPSFSPDGTRSSSSARAPTPRRRSGRWPRRLGPHPLTDNPSSAASRRLVAERRADRFERSDGSASRSTHRIGRGGLRQTTNFKDRNSAPRPGRRAGTGSSSSRTSSGEAPSGIFVMGRDGSNLRRLTSKRPGGQDPASFNPFWAPVATTPGA